MPTYLRVILVAAHLPLYDRSTLREHFMLGDSEYQPDILDDFRTHEGELSLFEVDLEQQPVELIVCAVAAHSNRNQERGYILVDGDFFSALGLPSPQKTMGTTASLKINETHFNIQLGTTQRRLELAHAIVDNLDPVPIPTADMKKYLVEFYHAGELKSMNKNLRVKLGLDSDESE
ncbi:MAG: hypothetical protein IIA60_10800 [Candidatus Marinimicrobia bacterium]|nr:hypothetical protein [Candidatus Neomarinimicrobiota bacterium]